MYGNRLTEKKGKDKKSLLCVKKAWRYLTNSAIWGKWLGLWNSILVSLLWTNYGSLKDIRGFPGNSAGEESTCTAGDPGLIPGSGSFPDEGIGYPLQYSWDSLGAQMVKNPPACRRPGFYPWVGKIPWRRAWQLTPVLLPGEFPWTEEPGGLQSVGSQSQMTGWLSTAQHKDKKIMLLYNSLWLLKCTSWLQHNSNIKLYDVKTFEDDHTKLN